MLNFEYTEDNNLRLYSYLEKHKNIKGYVI